MRRRLFGDVVSDDVRYWFLPNQYSTVPVQITKSIYDQIDQIVYPNSREQLVYDLGLTTGSPTWFKVLYYQVLENVYGPWGPLPDPIKLNDYVVMLIYDERA